MTFKIHGLTGSSFSQLLSEASHPEFNNYGYLCRKKGQEEWKILFYPKKSLEYTQSDYFPITLRKLSHIAYDLKGQISKTSTQAKIVAHELLRMSARARIKEGHRFFLIRILFLICDCARNFFSGYGWHSTRTLTKDLAEEFQSFASPNHFTTPEQDPSSVSPTNLITLETVPLSPRVRSPESPKYTTLARKHIDRGHKSEKTSKAPKHSSLNQQISSEKTSRKVQALNKYINNPKENIPFEKNLLFKDIVTIIDPLDKTMEINQINRNRFSLYGLMKLVSNSKIVDLKNPNCEEVILDAFFHCNKETSIRLIEWIITEETFHVGLMKRIFEVLEERAKEQPIDPFAIEQLIKTYINKHWNVVKDIKDDLICPANDSAIATILARMLIEDPNNTRKIRLIEWVVKQPEYDFQTFSKIIEVFMIKEAENAAAPNLHYPIRDLLLSHIKKEWQSQMKNNLAAYVRKYEANS
jgi:hypothetical protein